jgi:hypothetical protein
MIDHATLARRVGNEMRREFELRRVQLFVMPGGGGDADRSGQARPLFRGTAIDFIADRGRAGKPCPSAGNSASERRGVFEFSATECHFVPWLVSWISAEPGAEKSLSPSKRCDRVTQ